MSSWRIDDKTPRSAPLTETTATAPARRADRDAQRDAVPVAEETERTDLRAAVAQLEAFVREMERDLRFRIDAASGRVVVSVIDGATGEIIRQIPGEDVLRLAARLDATGLNLLHPHGVRA